MQPAPVHLQVSTINNEPIGQCHKGSLQSPPTPTPYIPHSISHTAHYTLSLPLSLTRARARTRTRTCTRGGSGCSCSCWKPGWDDHACLASGVNAAAVAGSGLDLGRRVGLVPDRSYLDVVSMLSSRLFRERRGRWP